MKLTGSDQLYFYDAIAPIVAADFCREMLEMLGRNRNIFMWHGYQQRASVTNQ